MAMEEGKEFAGREGGGRWAGQTIQMVKEGCSGLPQGAQGAHHEPDVASG